MLQCTRAAQVRLKVSDTKPGYSLAYVKTLKKKKRIFLQYNETKNIFKILFANLKIKILKSKGEWFQCRLQLWITASFILLPSSSTGPTVIPLSFMYVASYLLRIKKYCTKAFLDFCSFLFCCFFFFNQSFVVYSAPIISALFMWKHDSHQLEDL